MGRVKLEIKKLESKTNRLTTYSKRKNGVMKKTEELAVLCDIDVALLMFSPSGKPLMWTGKNSSFEGIVERYASLTPPERARRKLEGFDALQRSFKNSGHVIHAGDFFGSSYQTIGDLTTHVNLLRNRLSEVQNRLSDWENPDKIVSIQRLDHMEDYIRKLLDQIHVEKENIRKQQFLAPGRSNLPHTGHLPFSLRPSDLQEQVRQCSWIQHDESQHTFPRTEPNFLPGKEIELSGGIYLGNTSDIIGSLENPEFVRARNEIGLLCELMKTENMRNELIGLRAETWKNELRNEEFLKNEMMTSEYLRNELAKAEFLTNELINIESIRSMREESFGNEEMKTRYFGNDLLKVESLRNEVTDVESSRLQLYQQHSYPHHDLSILSSASQIDLQFCIDELCADRHTETSHSGCGFDYSSLRSTNAHASVIMSDEHSYPRQTNSHQTS